MASNFYKAGAAAMTSNKDDWETPQSLFDQLDEEFHFILDAASSDQNAKCEHHYTAENSGLEHSWEGETVFCNPPYGRNIGDWIRKASQEASKPDTLVVLLVPARTDTRWFQNHILHRAEVRFLPGRLKYEVNGQAGEAAPSFWREGTPSFRAVVNHSGRFWFSMYRFNVSNGAPPLVPA